MAHKKAPNKGGLSDKLTSYGDPEFSKYLRTVFLKSMGYTDDALDRPIIGIANTYSAYNSCHATVPILLDAIKRGVMLAGGLPILGEGFGHQKNQITVIRSQILSQPNFTGVRPIGFCSVKKPYSPLQCCFDNLLGDPFGGPTDMVATNSQHGYIDPGFSQFSSGEKLSQPVTIGC